MLPNVTQSYKDQTWKVAGLKLCSECLSLSIILLYKNMQPFERDRQELCVIQKITRQAAVTLLKILTERKLWTERCVGQDRHFQPMLIESEWKTKN